MNGCFPGAFGSVCDWRGMLGHVGSRDGLGSIYGRVKRQKSIVEVLET